MSKTGGTGRACGSTHAFRTSEPLCACHRIIGYWEVIQKPACGRLLPVGRPASGNRIGTATWMYNAHSAELECLTPAKSSSSPSRYSGDPAAAHVLEAGLGPTSYWQTTDPQSLVGPESSWSLAPMRFHNVTKKRDGCTMMPSSGFEKGDSGQLPM